VTAAPPSIAVRADGSRLPCTDVEAAIRLHGVTKRFGAQAAPAVAELDLEVPTGAVVALIGPSGCGKTTTLRMINRLIEPTSGRIEVGGVDVTSQDVTQLRRGIGYVIQEVGLFPHRTVAQNIATVPKVLGWDRSRRAERVEELVDLVGLDRSLLERYPRELSGGQQQRVGVARALAADPPVLLMDEPFGAVDPIVRNRLQDELRSLQARLHKTIVLVTHDIDEAIRVADRIALMNVGGVLEQYDTPDEMLRAPASEFVEQFIGADRGMKRLRLHTVDELPFLQGPVVDGGAGHDEADAVLAANGGDWLGVTTDGRFAGWVHRDRIDRSRPLHHAPLTLPAAQVVPSSTLHHAVEVIMASDTSVAVIDDGGRFGGVATLEHIRRGLSQHDGTT
jgi:osmoprotectant transport system ATP-binding protein